MMEVNLAALMPAAWNPRSRPDPAGIEELANSIQEHGVIQPIVVRAVKSSNPAEIDSYQIVCGSRRVDAAERAGLITIPAVERNVEDQAAAEIAMAENIQDERMDPLDEAEGYHHTMTGTEPVGVNEIARRLGVSVSRVRRRLRLLDLVIDAKTMLVKGAITLAHADHLVRIPEGAQKEALHVCTTSTVFDDIEEPAPVGRLAEWIGKNVKTELDPEIIEDYFPEIVEEAVNDVEAVPTMLKLSASMQPGADMGDKKHGMIGAKSWIEIGGDVPPCEHDIEGVIVHGAPFRVVRVCAKKGCPVHRPPQEKAPAKEKKAKPPEHDWKAEQEKREQEQREWDDERPSVVKAFIEHLKEKGLKLDAALVRKTVNTEQIEEYFADAFGPDWKFDADKDIPFVLACAYVSWWRRDAAKGGLKEFGFKMPPKPKAKKVAAPKPAAPKPKKKRAPKKKVEPTAEQSAQSDAEQAAEPEPDPVTQEEHPDDEPPF